MRSALIHICCCLAAAICFARGTASPEERQIAINEKHDLFHKAQKRFIPWYTGPLITGSSVDVPTGKINIQPYLFVTSNFGEYNSNRKAVNVEDRHVVNPLFIFQYGVCSWLDVTVAPQGVFQWRGSESGYSFGDTALTFGLQLRDETLYAPSIRLFLGETFPTGKYEGLSVNKGGLDSAGAGAYSTTIGLNLGKILYWLREHPMRLRFSASYVMPNDDVRVKGFNAYGGGFGTDGKIDKGDTLNIDFGYELSITQRWVLACDVAYTYSNANHFSGTSGTKADGTPATHSQVSSDQLSLAPAIEYNVSDKGGFIGGVWFTVAGRNASQFASAVLSYTYLF